MKKNIYINSSSPVVKCFICSAKSNRRYRRLTEIIRACALRMDLKVEMGLSPRMHQTFKKRFTKRLIIGIIRTVTEAYESHRLLADLRHQNGKVKTRVFCHLHPSFSSIRNYQQ